MIKKIVDKVYKRVLWDKSAPIEDIVRYELTRIKPSKTNRLATNLYPTVLQEVKKRISKGGI